MLTTYRLPPPWLAAAAAGAGLAGGFVVGLEPRLGLLLVGAELCVFALIRLQGAALAWSVALVAALPYYDFQEGFRQPALPPWLIAGLALLALGVPWAWAWARAVKRPRPSVTMGIFGGLVLVLLAVSFSTLGPGTLLEPLSTAFFAGAAAFLCARRFTKLEEWCPAALAALIALLALGAVAFASAPGGRLGSFTGYPILFAGLVVGLLPPAVAYLYPRSRVLALALVGASFAALIFSQTRSAWLAAVVVALVGVALLVRLRQATSGLLLVMLSLALVALAMSTPALSAIVETRLTEGALSSESFTHRQSIYGYTAEKLAANPLLGERGPGNTKSEIDLRTGIDAADSGFLSLAADLGLLGLAVGLVPVLVVLRSLSRLWRRGRASFGEVGVTLGVLALCILTLFFDTYYWTQSSMLLFAMAGALSARGRDGPARSGGPVLSRVGTGGYVGAASAYVGAAPANRRSGVEP